ncbi:MAG: hypothetical protein CM15mP74_12380 [Halieaceae bacterium]|nr:MAG: hypothetical protein CM15mP74_12380 [Halieaceae bacterium]
MEIKLNNLVILGGGTAGWLCAAVLAKRLQGSPVKVTLIESEDIGLIGVGEATIPPIRAALSFLGIDKGAICCRNERVIQVGYRIC